MVSPHTPHTTRPVSKNGYRLACEYRTRRWFFFKISLARTGSEICRRSNCAIFATVNSTISPAAVVESNCSRRLWKSQPYSRIMSQIWQKSFSERDSREISVTNTIGHCPVGGQSLGYRLHSSARHSRHRLLLGTYAGRVAQKAGKVSQVKKLALPPAENRAGTWPVEYHGLTTRERSGFKA